MALAIEPNPVLSAELKRLYHKPDDPASYGGVEKLYTRAKQLRLPGVTRAKVRAFLQSDASYSLHKPARRHFRRNRTFVAGIDDQWQADLVDMQALSRQNHGTKYLLTCIDVFSKYAWVVPVRAKSGPAIAEALRELFKQAAPRLPKKLQTDKGKEFLNATVQTLLRDTYHVKHFSSWSDQKAAVVERFNRTLKAHMWRYFTSQQTHRYLDVLPKLVHAYNDSWHRAIGLVPAHVTKRDEPRMRKRLYGRDGLAAAAAAAAAPPLPPTMDPHATLEPGVMVRISRVKGDFEKGYVPNWSEEDFRIQEISDRHGPRRIYKLVDSAGERVHGVFYRDELQPISENRYLVERIIRRRPLPDGSGAREALVQWRGWPAKFNTWIPESDLEPVAAAADG